MEALLSHQPTPTVTMSTPLPTAKTTKARTRHPRMRKCSNPQLQDKGHPVWVSKTHMELSTLTSILLVLVLLMQNQVELQAIPLVLRIIITLPLTKLRLSRTHRAGQYHKVEVLIRM